MKHEIRVNLFWTAVVLAGVIGVSVLSSVGIAARAYTGRPGAEAAAVRDVTVKGVATRRIVSDTATWRVTVRSSGTSLSEAYESLERGAERLGAFLGDAGFAEGEVSWSSVDTDTIHRRDERGRSTDEVVGYQLSQVVSVVSGDVERVSSASGRVTELLKEEIRVESRAPSFTVADTAGLKVDLVAAATADARGRAESMALRAGGTVGALKDARQGVIQITRPHSTSTSSYGVYDTGTIEKDIRVVVTAKFGLEGG